MADMRRDRRGCVVGDLDALGSSCRRRLRRSQLFLWRGRGWEEGTEEEVRASSVAEYVDAVLRLGHGRPARRTELGWALHGFPGGRVGGVCIEGGRVKMRASGDVEAGARE